MVTTPSDDRLAFVRRSIAGYLRQTHHRRELLIIVQPAWRRNAEAVRAHVSELRRSDIRVLESGPGMSLGALRNLSVAAARGDLVCQWDDDDLCHPRRIERQLAALTRSGKGACYLQDVMQCICAERSFRWLNFRATPQRTHAATGLVVRGRQPVYPEEGPKASLGEDSHALLALIARDDVAVLEQEPHLFVYMTHGRNVSNPEHHRMLADRLSLSRGLILRREREIRAGLAAFDFGTGRFTFCGGNGPAFEFEGRGGSIEP